MQSEGGAAGRAARRAAERRADDDVHRLAGPAADDPEHVQDRRRADAGGVPRGRALAGGAGAVDLRRPLRRDGGAADRLGAARSARCRRRTTWRSSRRRRRCATRVPFVHFFDGFRTSHEMQHDRAARRRRPARDDRRRAGAARTAARRSRPSGRSSAARRRTPTSTSRRARRSTRTTPRVPGVVQDAMDRFADAHRPPLPAVRLQRRTRMPSACSCVMGSGGETVRETVDCAQRARRAGRRGPGAAVPARSRREALLDGAAADRAPRSPCSIAPRSPARRRAAVPGCGRRARARRRGRRRGDHAADRRRPLRPVVEGVHPGDGRRRVRRARARAAAATTSRSASTTTSRTRASPTTRASTSSQPRRRARVFYGLGADGTVGANKNTIKIIGEERPATRRATSSTTRRSRARRPSRTCASGRGRSARLPRAAGQLRRLPPVRVRSSGSTCWRAAPGATFLLNSPLRRRTRSGTRCRARCRSRSRQAASRCTSSTPAGSPREAGMAGRINTFMQTCFFAISGVLPRDEAIARDQGGDREDLRPARRRAWSSGTSRPSTARWSICTRSTVPEHVDGHARAAAAGARATRRRSSAT